MSTTTETLALNAVCPYYTMFPLDFPLGVLTRGADEDAWVLDPFCGRGTTNFAARTLGLRSIGLDSSPVATAVAVAKLQRVTPLQVLMTAKYILNSRREPLDLPAGEFWRYCFHRKTLQDLCRLRGGLLVSCDTGARRVLRAIVLGALHGPITKTTPSYFSNQCPRTFSPKPRYAVKFWQKHRMSPPEVEVLKVIWIRARRFLSHQPAAVQGIIREVDSRSAQSFEDLPPVSIVITSPPYYGMHTYIQDQWVRNWFLGGPAEVPYERRRADMSHSSPEEFTDQLATVWKHVRKVCKSGARLVARFGGIQDRKQDPVAIFKESIRLAGWQLLTARSAGTALDGRRQASQFRLGESSPRLEYDFYAAC